jgi:hypothetical protein
VNGPRLAIDDITGLIDAGKKNGYLIHNEVDGVSRTRGQRRNPLSRSLLDITRPHPAATGIETPHPVQNHQNGLQRPAMFSNHRGDGLIVISCARNAYAPRV